MAFPIFSAFRKTLSRGHKALVGKLLSALLPTPLIRAETLPVTARATVLAGEKATLLCLKVTYPENRGEGGSVEEHTTLPAGRQVSVKGEYAAATLVPCGTPVEMTVKDGYTRLALPEITGYAVVKLL